jgi:hypothetical protein
VGTAKKSTATVERVEVVVEECAPALREQAVNGRGRRSALGTPKNGELVPKNDYFEVLELTRPPAQRHEFEQPPQQHVAERHEHEASSIGSVTTQFYAQDCQIRGA